MARRIESLLLAGPAGLLEGLLEEPEDQDPGFAAVLCHPHPLYGGTMHNKVIYRLARGLRRLGGAVLRFNFRGVGRSSGSYDEGRGELEDARAALQWLQREYAGLPCWLGGFSFGARVALALGCQEPAVQRILAVGLPVQDPERESRAYAGCTREKIFLQSTHDEFGPRDLLEQLVQLLPGPKRLLWVEAADHFFSDALDSLEEAVTRL